MHASRCILPMVAAAASGVAAQDARPPFEANAFDSAVVYEVNVRQYSPEGTFAEVEAQFGRLSDLGVDMLWLMPIHPIGQVNRLGSLGSYYSVRDYKAVNPEFGTAEDFRRFVDEAHAEGMLVMLDWVANHTAWDHVWTTTHPERFTMDAQGNFVPPIPQWGDVIDLNFDNPDTHAAMLDAMKWWVEEFDIDGFRCDYAQGVPAEFWTTAIRELRQIRPLYMLAEAHEPWLLDCGFDALYGWGLGDGVLRVVRGDDDANGLRGYIDTWVLPLTDRDPPRERLHFTSNHDWNSWEGTAVSRFGPALDVATVLTFTLPGIPLIYSGQEAGIEDQLAFFDKDLIDWRPHPAADLYTKLAHLRDRNPAAQRASAPIEFEWLSIGPSNRVLAFRRTMGLGEVVVVANLSSQTANLGDVVLPRQMRDLDGQIATVPQTLDPWGWVVLTAP